MNRYRSLVPLLLVLSALLAGCDRPVEAPANESSTPSATEAVAECVRTPPAQPMVCTMDWKPVCGCDGITYPNACGARAAGITEFRDGECETERPQ
ncbi:MAG: Kazal-type serine protease inhibitor family protein [Xanthomonadales bacterium]